MTGRTKGRIYRVFIVLMAILLVVEPFLITYTNYQTYQTVYAEDSDGDDSDSDDSGDDDDDDSDTDSEDDEDGEDDSDSSGGDSDDSGSSSSSENIFDGIDDERKAIILGRVSYDKRIHYAITYAILKGTILSESDYSTLALGGQYAPGTSSGVEGLGDIVTGSSNIIKTEETSEDPYEQQALDNGEDPEKKDEEGKEGEEGKDEKKDEKKDENKEDGLTDEEQEKLDELTNEATELITDMIMNSYFYAEGRNAIDRSNIYKEVYVGTINYSGTGNFELTGQIQTAVQGGNVVKVETLKKGITKSKIPSGKIIDSVRKEVNAEVKSKYKGKEIVSFFNALEKGDNKKIHGILKSHHDATGLKFQNKVNPYEVPERLFKGGKADSSTVIRKKSAAGTLRIKTINKEDEVVNELRTYLQLIPLGSLAKKASADTSYITDRVSDRLKYMADNYAKKEIPGDSHVGKMITKVKNNKDMLNKYGKNLENITEEESEGNIKGIAWLPLKLSYPGYGSGAKEGKVEPSKDDFTNLIKSFDGGELTSDGSITSMDSAYSGKRNLQLNDLSYVESKRLKKVKNVRKKLASPYLSMLYLDHVKKKNNEEDKVRLIMGTKQLLPEIIHYMSFKVEDPDASKAEKNLVEKILDFWKGDKLGKTEPLSDGDLGTNTRLTGQGMTGLVLKTEDVTKKIAKTNDTVIGIDNYGNLINGQSYGVVVPYWQNRNIKQMEKIFGRGGKRDFLSSPALKLLSEEKVELVMLEKSGAVRETDEVLDEKILDFVTEERLEEAQDQLKELNGNSPGEMKKAVSDGGDITQAIAFAIVNRTSDAIADFNKDFRDEAEASGELYVSKSSANAPGEDGNAEDDFDAEGLLRLIQEILEIGFYDLLRKTIASFVVAFYTSTVMNFGLNSVFYTELISDTPTWNEILPVILSLMIAFTGAYIVYLGFRLMRQTISISGAIKQFVAVTLIVLIPTVVYSPIVHFVINKPTQNIVGKQMEQMSMIDVYIEENKEYAEADPLYEKFFGSAESLRDRTEDYLVDFYTTEHIKGFDITTVKVGDSFQDSELGLKEYIKKNTLSAGNEWSRNDLVRVRVSIFDLFEWVMVEGDTPLFEWLAQEKDSQYPGIGDYTEYYVDTSVVYEGLGVNEAGRDITASELFRIVHRNLNDKGMGENITGLYKVTNAFRQRKSSDEDKGLSDQEREAFIRDLSLAGKIKENLYGSNDGLSENAKAVMERYGDDMGEVDLTDDFFKIEEIIDELVLYRDMNTTELYEDVYNVNRRVLDDYVTNLSVVREAVGTADDNYVKGEYHMIMMRLWFSLNKSLGIKMFPTEYGVDTISLDSYMRLIYVPMGDYFDVNTVDIQNVSEYITLRTHPVGAITFLLMILALMVFGFVYVLVFYVLLMIISTFTFLYHHVYKEDHNNKSWLGTVMVILSFGLAKLGLLIIWKVMSFALNYSYVRNGGHTYPYMTMHSIIALAYTLIALWLLWTKVIKKVIEDKGNLGGEAFMEGIGSLKDKVVSGFNKVFGGYKDGGGGSGGGSGLGSGVDNLRGREGSSGRLGKTAGVTGAGYVLGKNLGSMQSQTRDVMRSLKSSDAQDRVSYISSTLAEKQAEMNENVRDGYTNIMTPDGKVKEVRNSVKDLYLQGSDDRRMEANKKIMGDYDNIIPTQIAGLTEKEQSKLEGQEGTRLGDTQKFQEFVTSNSEEANMLTNYLKNDMGMEAYQDGDKVLVKSGDYNFNNAEDRRAVFSGLVDHAGEKLNNIENIYEDVESTSGLNYVTNSDGSVSVGVGSAGISTKTLNQVLDSNGIKDNFIVESKPVEKNGEYLQGQVVLRPITTGVGVDGAMKQAFNLDEALRDEVGEAPRESKYNRRLGVGNTEEVHNKIVNEAPRGMSLQGDQLHYDSGNKEHVEYAKNLSQELTQQLDNERTLLEQVGVKTMSHVVHGGNNGFETNEYVVGGDNVDKRTTEVMQNYGVDPREMKNQVSYFGGKYAEEVATHLNNSKVFHSVEGGDQFLEQQSNIHNIGEQLLDKKVATTDNPTEAKLDILTQYAERTGISRTEVDRLHKQRLKLEESLNSSKLTTAEYKKGMEKLTEQTADVLKKNGKYDDVMTKVIREDGDKLEPGKSKENLAKVDNYIKKKREMESLGISGTTGSARMYKDMNLDQYGIDLKSIKGVRVGQDSKLHIDTDGTVPQDKLDKLVNDMVEQARKTSESSFTFEKVEDNSKPTGTPPSPKTNPKPKDK